MPFFICTACLIFLSALYIIGLLVCLLPVLPHSLQEWQAPYRRKSIKHRMPPSRMALTCAWASLAPLSPSEPQHSTARDQVPPFFTLKAHISVKPCVSDKPGQSRVHLPCGCEPRGDRDLILSSSDPPVCRTELAPRGCVRKTGGADSSCSNPVCAGEF